MGEAKNEYQQDPLNFIFNDIYDRSSEGEVKKLKLYHSFYTNGQRLQESCGYLGPNTYATPWQEKQAKRSVVAALQYVGLDQSIKAIGAYAKKMDVSEEDYKRLSSNLVRNYCSKNVTVYSLRNIEKALEHYYKTPDFNVIPSVETSPFATELYKKTTESHESRSREMDYAVRNFRAFCSWGGDVVDYRLLAPYLNNRFIMSFIFRNLNGVKETYNVKSQSVSSVKDEASVQVICTDLICRKTSLNDFKEKFSTSVGSTGISSDLQKLYCHHFRFQDYNPSSTLSEVKAWMKEAELEDPIYETNFFLSQLNGVPDALMGIKNYKEIPFLAKSSMDERWTQWAQNVLSLFSKDLLYEESLKVKAIPQRDKLALRTKGFILDFNITLGEMDRLMNDTDKLDLSFDLKLTKNYLRSIRTKWSHLAQEIDTEGQKNFKTDVAQFIEIQLKEKEKLFSQVMWTKEFSRLIADELIEQALTYQGPLFDSYKEEVLRVPVKFTFGVFALSYLRYRADVAGGRLKLSL